MPGLRGEKKVGGSARLMASWPHEEGGAGRGEEGRGEWARRVGHPMDWLAMGA